MMKEYETLVILKPDLTEDVVGQMSDRLGNLVKKGKGMVLGIENLGKRPLSYTMKKHPKGSFLQINFQAEGSVIHELEHNLRLSEDVVRFMTTQKQPRRKKAKELA